MKPTKQAVKALTVLLKWQLKYEEKQVVYNQFLHDIEAFFEFETFDYLDAWFYDEFEADYQDRFLSFASDATGGQYCLWYYPDLLGEPPVVFLGSEGETNLLAPSLTDFVLLFTAGKILDAGMDNIEKPQDLWREMYTFEAKDLAEDLGLSPEKAKEALEKSFIEFKDFVHSKIEEKPFATIFSEIANHPDFVAWVDAVRDEHQEEMAIPDVEEDPLTLDLSYSDFSDVPKELVLANLDIETLDLSGNEITKIPDFLSQLKNLKTLHLNNNQITEIPQSFSKLKNLKTIYLDNNKITEIPQFFEDFEHLVNLDLHYNNIKALKLDFTKLKSFKNLSIYENPDLDFIDPSIYKIKTLVSIDYEDTLLENSLPYLEFMEQCNSPRILSEITDRARDLVDEDEANLPRVKALFEKRIAENPCFETYYSYAHFIQYSIDTDDEKALKMYLKAIEYDNDPDFDPVAYTHLAKIYYYHLKSDFDLAEKYYNKAIELDKENAFALDMYISFVVSHKKDYKKAAKLFKKLINISGNDTSYLEDYADFLKYKLEKPKKALKIYKKLLRIKPGKKRYLKYYAETLAFDLYKPEKAIKSFKKLLKKKKSADNYYNLITALKAVEADPETIINLFEKGRKKHPKDDFLNNDYYEYLIEIGKVEKLVELIDNDQANEHVFAQYIAYLRENDKNEKCKTIIEKGLDKFPDSDKILWKKLDFLTNTEAENSQIITVANKLLALTENDKLIKRLQLIIASKREINENSSEFDKLIANKNGDIPELVKSAGEAFAEKEFDKVLAILKAIEKIDPYQNDMLSMYYHLLKVNKSEKVAIRFLKDKLAKKMDVNVLILLISIYIKAQKDKEALEYIDIAQKHFPEHQQVIKFVNYAKGLKITATSEAEFESLLKENPEDTAYLNAYGAFLFDEENYKKAIKIYQKIIELDKESVGAYINTSLAFGLLNNTKKEAQYINEAIAVNPLKALAVLMSVAPFNMEKYMNIAIEKHPENKQLIDWVAMVKKMM